MSAVTVHNTAEYNRVQREEPLVMLLIFQGWAGFAGLIATGVLAATLQSATASRAFSFFVAGFALAAFGWYVNSPFRGWDVYSDNSPKEGRHAFFWIPIQYWGLLIGVGALLGL